MTGYLVPAVPILVCFNKANQKFWSCIVLGQKFLRLKLKILKTALLILRLLLFFFTNFVLNFTFFQRKIWKEKGL